jgi:hypothetical protein
MRRRSQTRLISLALFGLAALLPPTAVAESAARNVTVKLINYRVVPSVTSTAGGRVTFVVHNADNVLHNLVVLRTSIAPRSFRSGASTDGRGRLAAKEVPPSSTMSRRCA